MLTIMSRLQEPFTPEEIEWRVGSTNQEKTMGLALAYVTNRAIQNRLDEVFGIFGWQNQFCVWKGNSQICGISVWDESKKEWITKWDGADDSATEAVKGGLSDSMKRAAYQWGIGRYLYNLESEWVAIKPVGKSYAIVKEPRLPQWALPEGYEYNTNPKNKEPKNDSAPSKITEIQAKELDKIAKDKNADVGQMLAYYKVNSFNEMSDTQYTQAKNYLIKRGA